MNFIVLNTKYASNVRFNINQIVSYYTKDEETKLITTTDVCLDTCDNYWIVLATCEEIDMKILEAINNLK